MNLLYDNKKPCWL